MIIGVVGRLNGNRGSAKDCKSAYDEVMATGIARGHFMMIDTSIKHMRTAVDFIIVVGGDGTMLTALKQAAGGTALLVGVNLGRLGFITDVPHDMINALFDALEREQIHVEERSMLRVGDAVALNEVVIMRVGSIVDFNVYFDSQFAYSARGDGLMISTPTGSTAYALSAGASIIHPSVKALEVIPMMPQTLSCRPIIIPDTVSVQFELVKGHATVTADGHDLATISGDVISVSKATEIVKLAHPRSPTLNYDYYHTLREKLHWQLPAG